MHTLDKACSFLDFEDVQNLRSSRGATGQTGKDAEGGGEEGNKEFYEDPSLNDDEKKMNDAIEEKNALNALL